MLLAIISGLQREDVSEKFRRASWRGSPEPAPQHVPHVPSRPVKLYLNLESSVAFRCMHSDALARTAYTVISAYILLTEIQFTKALSKQ
jgi:hypothetical protein